MVRPTRLSRALDRILGEHDPWWKGVLLPKDRWWRISAVQAETDAAVGKTVAALDAYGLSWLERHGAA
jgi:hypothetical protein